MADAMYPEPVMWPDLEALRLEHAKPVRDTIPTPLPSWSQSCRGEGGGLGLAPGWLALIAGKPGMNKTNLALNTACSAMRAGVSVYFHSLEMSRSQLLTRLIPIATGCDIRRIERGAFFDERTFTEAMEAMNAARLLGRLYLCPRPGRTLGELDSAVREAADTFGCRLAVVDYVQLVGRAEYPSMFERTQAVSGRLQQIAFETGMTVLALSQLNRAALAQRNEEPGIEALKGGSLDEDADQVVLLDFTRYERTAHGATTYLLVAKNRHGPSPRIPVEWDFRTMRVAELLERDRYGTSRLEGGPRP